MKIDVVTLTKTNAGKRDLPAQFDEQVRPDLVKRAVEVIQSNDRQPYGAKSTAGMRSTAKLSRRRRDYKGSYGIGIGRTPRKIMSHQGTRFNWVGAFAPGTVGGRRSHPPKAYKLWDKKINKIERRKAIRSALAATMVKNLVQQRGHVLPPEYPFIIESKMETISKTADLVKTFEKLGFGAELERASVRHVRAGKGKSRGRKYQRRTGPLIVVGNDCPLLRLQNLSGVDIVRVDSLNADILAPGADVGRLTIFTEAAIDRLAKEGLYNKHYTGPVVKKESKPVTKTADAAKQVTTKATQKKKTTAPKAEKNPAVQTKR